MKLRDIKGRFRKPRKVLTIILALWVLGSSAFTANAIYDLFEGKTVIANDRMSYEEWLQQEVDYRFENDEKIQKYLKGELEAVLRISHNVINNSVLSGNDKEIVNNHE